MIQLDALLLVLDEKEILTGTKDKDVASAELDALLLGDLSDNFERNLVRFEARIEFNVVFLSLSKSPVQQKPQARVFSWGE
jgi:hypothetical protein